jgi:hypothetical protein
MGRETTMTTPNRSPFFVVFDTCTQARYYGDVHEVLALPPGAAITYEYSRRLFAPSAVRKLDELAEDPSPFPLPALLMYGRKRNLEKGSGRDPDEMLCWADSIFVPTGRRQSRQSKEGTSSIRVSMPSISDLL